jgi:hypothetical protein
VHTLVAQLTQWQDARPTWRSASGSTPRAASLAFRSRTLTRTGVTCAIAEMHKKQGRRMPSGKGAPTGLSDICGTTGDLHSAKLEF